MRAAWARARKLAHPDHVPEMLALLVMHDARDAIRDAVVRLHRKGQPAPADVFRAASEAWPWDGKPAASPPPEPRKPGSAPSVDWDAVDWRRRDVDIARDAGVTRERVRQVANDKGLPASSERHRAALLAWLRENYNPMWTAEDAAAWISQEFGRPFSPAWASEYARAAGVGGARGANKDAWGHDWGSVDWRQSTNDIARQLGAPPQSVANWRSKIRRNKWPVAQDGRLYFGPMAAFEGEP